MATAAPSCVPFCRAAIGALAVEPARHPNLAMELLRTLRERLRGLTAQRRESEIALAVLLTLAAAIFIAAALVGRGGSHHDFQTEQPFTTARKPTR
jgi:hypothetical protein